MKKIFVLICLLILVLSMGCLKENKLKKELIEEDYRAFKSIIKEISFFANVDDLYIQNITYKPGFCSKEGEKVNILFIEEKKITSLCISSTIINSRLKEIPKDINKLTELELLLLGGYHSLLLKPSEKNLGNQIKEITNLNNLKKLETLVLSSNQIQKINGLSSLTKLKSLYLNDNQIQEIKGLNSLVNLELLDLSRNKIQVIKGLKKLKKLKQLKLNNNQIDEIKGIEELTNLEILDLKHNNITEIKNLDKLSNLRELDLRYNLLSPNDLKINELEEKGIKVKI